MLNKRKKFIKKLLIFIMTLALALTGSGFSILADEVLSSNSAQSVSSDTVSKDEVSDTNASKGTPGEPEEDTAKEAVKEEVSPNTARASEEELLEQNEEEGEEAAEEVSQNTISENSLYQNTVSQNTVSQDGISDNEITIAAISENAVFDIEEYIVSANEALKELNRDRVIPAVIVLCSEYGLRAEPAEDSEVLCELPVSTTVYPVEVAFRDGNFWFKVKTYVNEKEYSGYVIKNNLIYVDPDMLEWEGVYLEAITEALRQNRESAGVMGIMAAETTVDAKSDVSYVASSSISSFPATYQSALTALSAKHPNWVFVPQNVGVSFAAALSGELSDKNKNWIYYTAPASYKNGMAASSWYYASKSCLEYYMDPRNFLTDKYIFQFETLAYNSSYQTAAGVQKFLKNTFMSGQIPGDSLTYAQAFEKTGAANKVSPYHLAARVYQEQGVNGTSAIISGKYPGYEGYYNYFNIKASGSSPILNGLIYAKSMGWNTRYKSLQGGAEFLGSSYINRGQDTLYTQKYNVASSSSRYSHQYMQNAQAPSTESVAIYNIYNGSGSLNDAFIFKIPVYTDMTLPSDSEEAIEKALKVTPTVTLKAVRSVNVFGTSLADMGIYRISTAGNIVDVTDADLTTKTSSASPCIVLDHVAGNLAYLKAINVNNSNISLVNRNVKLSVGLDGYDAVSCSFKANIRNTKPTIKMKAAVIYTGLGSGEALITDSSGKSLSLPDDVTVTSSSSDISVKMGGNNSSVVITPVNATSFRAGTKKLTFSSSEWNANISVNVSIKKSSKPSMLLSDKTVIFNKTLSDATYTVSYSVNGSSLKVDSLDIEGANTKTKNALLYGYISAVQSGEGKVTLGFGSAAPAGTYTVRLTGTLADFGGAAYKMKSVNLSVKVVNKTPEQIVGISQKGNVNLVNREGSDRLYTLSRLNQIGASKITAAYIDGANSAYFKAVLLSNGETDSNGYTVTNTAGGIAVYAVEGAELSHKVNYVLPLKITLDNGYTLSKSVKLKPANSQAKLTALVSSITVTRGGSAKSCYIKSAGAGNYHTLISAVELVPTDKNSKYFTCSALSTGASKLYGVKLSINDDTMKPGRYTVRFNVYPKGKSTAANPVKVSVRVTVK